ncbi:MAG: uroporphyrinogen-III synthase [Pyrinomonadaceae bacterium]
MAKQTDPQTCALFNTPTNKPIVKKLEDAGMKVFKIPPPKTEPLPIGEGDLDVIRNLEALDWLVFFDVFSVDHFLAILEQNGFDPFELDRVRVCALGEATADRLRLFQVHSDLIPTSYRPVDVLSGFLEYAQTEDLGGLKILFLRGNGGKTELEVEFKKKGADLIEMPLYRFLKAEEGITNLTALLAGGAIDEFIFSAPEDMVRLRWLIPEESFAELLGEVRFRASDNLMLQSINETGLKASLI